MFHSTRVDDRRDEHSDEIQSWVILSSFVALSITASAQTSPAFCDVSHRMPDCTLAFGCPTTLIDGTARSRWSHDAAMRRARSISSNAASSAWWSQQMVGRLEKIQAFHKSYQIDGLRADPVESSEGRVEWAGATSLDFTMNFNYFLVFSNALNMQKSVPIGFWLFSIFNRMLINKNVTKLLQFVHCIIL